MPRSTKLGLLFAISVAMIRPCPNSQCLFFATKKFVKKDGRFYRQCQSRFIQRFKCSHCGKKFSHATGTLEFKQRKRRENAKLRELLCSGVSMRRAARLLKIHPVTVERKLVYLAINARRSHLRFLKNHAGKVKRMQFDDLITVEHTKLKPLTVSLAVDADERFILGGKVASIGAFGHLAEISRRKYGKRENKHKEALNELFKEISPTIRPDALIQSDEHQNYPSIVEKWLPDRNFERFKGGRGCIVGQGELKKLRFDPLFTLNHTCAMLRANINRLIRKTWCTTKSPRRLQNHLDIFVDYYNRVYLEGVKPHLSRAVSYGYRSASRDEPVRSRS